MVRSANRFSTAPISHALFLTSLSLGMRLEPRGDFFKFGLLAGDENSIVFKLTFLCVKNIPVVFQRNRGACYAGSLIAVKERMTRYYVARVNGGFQIYRRVKFFPECFLRRQLFKACNQVSLAHPVGPSMLVNEH